MGKQVVLAIFDDEPTAVQAVEALKRWDEVDDDVKLNAISILVLDENGNVVPKNVGRHTSFKGAGIGGGIGVLAVAINPFFGLGVLGWTIAGAATGRVVHKGLGMSEKDLERLHDAVWGGKAAIGVLVKDWQAPNVMLKLAQLGGVPETHDISESDLTEEATDAAHAEATAAADAGGAKS
jgi:uncharacterized membrane protein